MDSTKDTLKSATSKDSQSQSQFEKGKLYISQNFFLNLYTIVGHSQAIAYLF
jgi:hypothetical protein